jgi:hypothetical protein
MANEFIVRGSIVSPSIRVGTGATAGGGGVLISATGSFITSDGSAILGPTGPTGPTGPQGVTGPTGALSLTGSTDNGLLTLNGSSPNVAVESTLRYDGVSLFIDAQSGDEGADIKLIKPVTNSSITTGVTVDLFQNKFRIFETGGSNRGVYIDITDLQTNPVVNLAPYRYLYARRASSSQTSGGSWTNTDVIFNSVVASLGISFNTTTGVATLAPGTYRISAQLAWTMGSTYVIPYSLYDTSNNQLGPLTEQLSTNFNTSNYSPGDLDFIYTTGATIDVKIRIGSTSASTGESIRADLNTSFIIQQIG